MLTRLLLLLLIGQHMITCGLTILVFTIGAENYAYLLWVASIAGSFSVYTAYRIVHAYNKVLNGRWESSANTTNNKA